MILDTFDKIKDIWFLVFKASLQQGTCPNILKTAKVTRLFKSADLEKAKNYRSILVLLEFFKHSWEYNVQSDLETPEK